MEASVFYTLVIGALIGLGVMAMFAWGASTGAFEKTEDAKYLVFRDEADDD